MTAIISLLVVLVLLLTVTRVAAVALRLTGMAPDGTSSCCLSSSLSGPRCKQELLRTRHGHVEDPSLFVHVAIWKRNNILFDAYENRGFNGKAL